MGDFCQRNATETLGEAVIKRFHNGLPYLLKVCDRHLSFVDLKCEHQVLSINSALSIQAHPNLQLAQRLHKEHPDLYKDANHKPEMALAVTPMSALCEFRPLEEILSFLNNVCFRTRPSNQVF